MYPCIHCDDDCEIIEDFGSCYYRIRCYSCGTYMVHIDDFNDWLDYLGYD